MYGGVEILASLGYGRVLICLIELILSLSLYGGVYMIYMLKLHEIGMNCEDVELGSCRN